MSAMRTPSTDNALAYLDIINTAYARGTAPAFLAVGVVESAQVSPGPGTLLDGGVIRTKGDCPQSGEFDETFIVHTSSWDGRCLRTTETCTKYCNPATGAVVDMAGDCTTAEEYVESIYCDQMGGIMDLGGSGSNSAGEWDMDIPWIPDD